VCHDLVCQGVMRGLGFYVIMRLVSVAREVHDHAGALGLVRGGVMAGGVDAGLGEVGEVVGDQVAEDG
jgi:hypothetical protein